LFQKTLEAKGKNMNSQSFEFDLENLIKAGKIPLIVSVALGLTWLLKIYLSYLYSPAITFLAAFAGAVYMKTLMDSGKTPLLTNAGLNSAILGGVMLLVYGLISEIASSIVTQSWSLDFLYLIFSVLEGAFVGLLGALAWYAYKTNINY
jgi:hypothetical protein